MKRRLERLRFRCEEIVELRKLRGWTQEDLAGAISAEPDCGRTAATTVSKWERGEVIPWHPVMLALVRISERQYDDWWEVR